MPWATPSRGDNRLTVLALPADVKAQLIRTKALTRRSVTCQVVEALRRDWGTPLTGPPPGVPVRVGCPETPAVNPAGDRVASGPYRGMRRQEIPASAEVPWRP
jgi:hypothetical protein